MTLQQIDNELRKVEAQLEKVRGKEYGMGWQTMQRAKTSRKWDFYARRKMELLSMRDELLSKTA